MVRILTTALIVTIVGVPGWSQANKDRLKSGGVASQLPADAPSSLGPSGAPAKLKGPPSQWISNVNVNSDPFEQDEPTVAVNPTNRANLVVGNHERQGPAPPAAIACAFQASLDGGVSFPVHGLTPLQGPLFPAPGGHSCSDSVLAADHNGNFYFAYLDLFRTTSPLRVDLLVATSVDGGASFPTPVLVAKGVNSGAGAEDPDKEWIEVDRDLQSPHRGNIYVTYSDFDTFTIKVRKSTNGGLSFQPPPTSNGVVVSDSGFQAVSAPYLCGTHVCLDVTTRYMQGSNIAVGPKGEIYVFYGDFTERESFDATAGFAFVNAQMLAAKIMSSKSNDEGANWNRTVVRDMCSGGPCRSAGTDAHETKNTPAIRVGTEPFGGVGPGGKNIYVVWGEWKSVVFGFDAGTNKDFAVSEGEIMFTRSTDGGTTWEPAIRIDGDTGTNDKFFANMVVAAEQVYVVWLDRKLDPTGVDYDVFYATSPNGKNFSSPLRVTTESSNPRGTNFIGDYIDIDGAQGPMKIHAVWTDRRSVLTSADSVANDVFTAERH